MQRYIPFGYKIENGMTVVNSTEANAVRTAFEMYIGGASYNTIAKHMESTGVNYRHDSTAWNKNMVKRILENERYTGTVDYPFIIGRSALERVSAIKAERNTYRPKPKEIPVSVPVAEIFIYTPNLETARLSKEIDREMDMPGFDKERIQNLILQCAAAKYAACAERGRE